MSGGKIKENATTKLLEFETMAEKFLKKDFISLAEACSVFDKSLKENESSNHFPPSLNEDMLKKNVEGGSCLLAVPNKVTGEDICSSKLFTLNLSPQEVVRLKKEVLRPGYIFVNKEPRQFSFGEMNMRDSGFKIEKDPKLLELMYAYDLSNRLGRRKMLVQRICTLCQDEVVRRGILTPVCFKKNTGTAIEILAWRSQMKPMNVLGIKRM